MKEFVSIRAKTYSCLMDDDREVKKGKGTKKCVIKTMLRHLHYKNDLLNNEVIKELQQRFKSEAHNVYTEEVNKIALSIDDDNRLQAYDGIATYPYGYKC